MRLVSKEFHLAKVMTIDARSHHEAEFVRSRSFYSEGEIVELMAAIDCSITSTGFPGLLEMEPMQPVSAEQLA